MNIVKNEKEIQNWLWNRILKESMLIRGFSGQIETAVEKCCEKLIEIFDPPETET